MEAVVPMLTACQLDLHKRSVSVMKILLETVIHVLALSDKLLPPIHH